MSKKKTKNKSLTLTINKNLVLFVAVLLFVELLILAYQYGKKSNNLRENSQSDPPPITKPKQNTPIPTTRPTQTPTTQVVKQPVQQPVQQPTQPPAGEEIVICKQLNCPTVEVTHNKCQEIVCCEVDIGTWVWVDNVDECKKRQEFLDVKLKSEYNLETKD